MVGVPPARTTLTPAPVVAHTQNAILDAELVARALDGSAWAEAALCRKYGRPVIGMLSRLLRSPHDADDIAQDAFVIALETLPRLKSPSAFRMWLFQIATNLAKKKLRRRRFERLLGLGPTDQETDLE